MQASLLHIIGCTLRQKKGFSQHATSQAGWYAYRFYASYYIVKNAMALLDNIETQRSQSVLAGILLLKSVIIITRFSIYVKRMNPSLANPLRR